MQMQILCQSRYVIQESLVNIKLATILDFKNGGRPVEKISFNNFPLKVHKLRYNRTKFTFI